MDSFKIALAQIESEPGNIPANLEKMLGYIEKASKEGAGLLIFPEMCLQGYMVMDGKDFRIFFEQAIDFTSEPIRRLLAAVKKYNINIIYGASTKSPEIEGNYYNSAILISADGVMDFYHKAHLPTGNKGGVTFYEGLYAKPGNEFPVFELKQAKIGIEVCYDIFFPEVSRILAIKGAEIIINISAAPKVSKIAFESIFPARALENVCYFVYVNVAGTQGELSFFGGSRVLGPIGAPLIQLAYEKEDFGIVELNQEALKFLRRQLPHLRDRARRPEIYFELLEDFG